MLEQRKEPPKVEPKLPSGMDLACQHLHASKRQAAAHAAALFRGDRSPGSWESLISECYQWMSRTPIPWSWGSGPREPKWRRGAEMDSAAGKTGVGVASGAAQAPVLARGLRCPLLAWSCKLSVMRLPVRFIVFSAALAVFALCAVGPAAAQSSSSQPGRTQTAPAPAPSTGVYVATNPLAGVNYDNAYDLSLEMAYDHMKAGPTLVQGSHLGGLNLTGSRWLTEHWGLQASGRAYIGTSGAGLNYLPSGCYLKGPVVKHYFFVGGPEWL